MEGKQEGKFREKGEGNFRIFLKNGQTFTYAKTDWGLIEG